MTRLECMKLFGLQSGHFLPVKSFIPLLPPPPPLLLPRHIPLLLLQLRLLHHLPLLPQGSLGLLPFCQASLQTTWEVSWQVASGIHQVCPSKRPQELLHEGPRHRPHTVSSCPHNSLYLSSSRTWRTS